jgi:sporulation protein YlmC with PRC-barrel domain
MLKRLLATTALVAMTSVTYAAEPAVKTDTTVQYMDTVNTDAAFASTLIGLPVYNGTAAAMPNENANAQPNNGANMQARDKSNAQAGDNANMQARNDAANQANPPNTANNPMPADTAQNTGDRIGDINDLVVARDGTVDAVIIGVGGFLGMGEKNVAVPFDNLQWSTGTDGKPALYLAATKDQLDNAPNFDVSTLWRAQPSVGNQQTPAPNDQMAMKTPAPADQTAMKTPDNTGNGTAAMDRNNLQAVNAEEITAKNLIDTTVYDSGNQDVGEVGDVVLTQDGQIDAIVVDVGGFLGIGEKPVAIAFDDLDIRRDENGNLVVFSAFTKDQLDGAPKYDKDAYTQQRDQMRLHSQS